MVWPDLTGPAAKAFLTYKAEWDELTRQMGYWVDLSDPLRYVRNRLHRECMVVD